MGPSRWEWGLPGGGGRECDGRGSAGMSGMSSTGGIHAEFQGCPVTSPLVLDEVLPCPALGAA